MPERDAATELADIRRELVTIRTMFVEVMRYIRDAESEVPEKLRRFMNYMHDLHDIKYMYEELGHTVPDHHLREMERCDDRFRQVIAEMNAQGGAIDKVRREMAADPNNRWDHTRQLAPPTHKEMKGETGSSTNGEDRNEGRADAEGSQPERRV